MSDKINIKGLDKADVLAALYNASRPLGMGFLHYDPNTMTQEEAQRHLALGDDHVKNFGAEAVGRRPKEIYFDYLKGRVLKVDLSGDEFSPFLYDRDNGDGAAAKVIAALTKAKGKP